MAAEHVMVEAGSVPVALLDACVLFPLALRDTLLDVAAAGFYVPRWSSAILDELERNLVADRGLSDRQAAGLVAAMRQHLPEADVYGFETLIPTLTNDPKDRHVLAAAVHAGAEIVVTDNLADFPPPALTPHGVSAMSADQFLTLLFDSEPDRIRELLIAQAAGYRAPAMTFAQLLARLKVHAPTLIARLVKEEL